MTEDLEIGFICHFCGNVTKHKESTIRELLDGGDKDSDVVERLKKLEDVEVSGGDDEM